jgi:MFS transporter, DHA1 family, tetracycline resistance protein
MGRGGGRPVKAALNPEALVTDPPAGLDLRKVLPVLIIVFVDMLGLTIIIPLLPLYAASFGASAIAIGLLGSAYPFMQFIGAPFLGRLSDHLGRRPVLIVSQCGTLAGFILLGLANSLPVIFASRLIDGLSGANLSTAQAVISDVTDDRVRTQGLGLIGAAFGLGFILGPVISFVSLAASGNNYRIPAFIAAGFSLLSILLTAVMLPETRPQPGSLPPDAARPGLAGMVDGLRRPDVGLLLVVMAGQRLAFGALEKLLSLFTLNRLGLNASGNAMLFVYIGVVVVAMQVGLIGRLSRRLGDRRLVSLGLMALTAGMLFTAATPRVAVPWYSRSLIQSELAGGQLAARAGLQIDLPPDTVKGWGGLAWLVAAILPVSLGAGVLHPSINSLISQRSRREDVGGALGLSAAFFSGGNALAPVLGGILYQILGPSAPFLAGAAILAILWLASRRISSPDSSSPT